MNWHNNQTDTKSNTTVQRNRMMISVTHGLKSITVLLVMTGTYILTVT